MKLIRFLIRCSRDIPHSRATIIMVVLTGVVSGAINAALLALINATIGRAGAAGYGTKAAFAALCLALPLVRFLSEVLLIRLSAAAIYDLRIRLSRRILAAPLRQLEELGVPRLTATLTEDIPVITNALTLIPLLCMHGAVVTGCLVYLGFVSPYVLLGVLCFMAVAVASYQLPMLRALRYFKAAREQWDTLFKHLHALTDGAKELKMHRPRREEFIDRVLSETATTLQRQHVAANTIYTAARSWGQVLIFILTGLLLFLSPVAEDFSIATRAAYILTLLYMMTPLEVILSTMPILGRANVSARKVEDLGLSLTEHPAEFKDENPPVQDGSWERLELRDVTHSYQHELEDHNFILGPLDVHFRRGEMVFVVGGNGSGKTTLAKLLTGLYLPESGEIRLDGRLIDDDNRDAYRQLFSVVFADFYLFESFLGLGADQLDARARHYLTRLQLEQKVAVEDGRLSTTKVSQGQRKRLALLTAYLEDRDIYLFDEWAADQDPLFKEVFYHQLLPELKARGKLVVVITHDDRYFHVADRVIKLDYGKVVYDEADAQLEKASPGAPVELA